jgi:DHA2 family multidrug resistance protein
VAGLQSAIEHQIANGVAVLSASISAGTSLPAEHLGATAAMLVGRGMETSAATRAAGGLLARSVGQQATVIAFDQAFILLALLFVVAAPVILLVKLFLARAARRRAANFAGERP